MSDGDAPSHGRGDDQNEKPVNGESEDMGQLAPRRRKGFFSGLFGGERRRDALSRALQSGDGFEGLSVERRDMLERVLKFDSIAVEDVMIPRADIVAIDEDISVTELLRVFSEAGHSRLPVYRGDLDDPRGMIHIKDLVGILADPSEAENKHCPLADIVRKLLYVPPSMPVTDLLLKMQARRIHMALVIDEFGGTDGLVTIEDLVEQIVGEIRDEHDDEDDPVLRAKDGNSWLANARVPLEDLEQETGLSLAVEEDDIDTLGGLVFFLAGHIPARGEIIRHSAGLEFEVIEADPRRIRKLLIRRINPDT